MSELFDGEEVTGHERTPWRWRGLTFLIGLIEALWGGR